MKKTTALSAIFLLVVFSFSKGFAQEEAEATVVSGKMGISSVQHDFDTGESKFHHPVGFLAVKIERTLSHKLSGCLEIFGYFALNEKSPNKGEKIELGGCLAYKPTKKVKLEISLANYRTRKYSVRKLTFLASKEWDVRYGSVKVYNNTMVLAGSDQHQRTGILNKTGVATTFMHSSSKTKMHADLSLGADNAPLHFEKSALTLFLKFKVEKKVSSRWSIFGEWKYSHPFTARDNVMSLQSGLAFHFDL